MEYVPVDQVDAVSLTSELDVRVSPAGRFFRERFRYTRGPLAQFREALQASPPLNRLPEDTPSHVYGYVGMAIDYRVRYHFAHTPWTELAATKGAGFVSIRPGTSSDSPITWVPAHPVHRVAGIPAEVIDQSTRDQLAQIMGISPEAVDWPTRIILDLPNVPHSFSIGGTTWVPEDPVVSGFFEALEEAVTEIAPHLRIPSEAEERTLARFCLTLSAFEAAYRAGPFAPWPPPHFGDILPGNVAELLALVPNDWVDDAAALGAEFVRRYSSWHGADAILNPSFAGSDHVGGADADLIVDGCLWELRTTKKRKAQGIWLYQLLGYVLLDYDNEYAIDSVGFLLPRQKTHVSWPVHELIAELSRRDDLDLSDLRESLRQICDSDAG